MKRKYCSSDSHTWLLLACNSAVRFCTQLVCEPRRQSNCHALPHWCNRQVSVSKANKVQIWSQTINLIGPSRCQNRSLHTAGAEDGRSNQNRGTHGFANSACMATLRQSNEQSGVISGMRRLCSSQHPPLPASRKCHRLGNKRSRRSNKLSVSGSHWLMQDVLCRRPQSLQPSKAAQIGNCTKIPWTTRMHGSGVAAIWQQIQQHLPRRRF